MGILQWWRQGRARGLQPPCRRHLAPRRRKFEYLSEENLEKIARTLHFSVILAPLSEAPAPLSEKFWRHPWYFGVADTEHFLLLWPSFDVQRQVLLAGIVEFFNRIENSIKIATLTIVIRKSRNLIGTLGIAEFGPESGQVFQGNILSLC